MNKRKLDVDALKVVSEGVNTMRGPDLGVLIITHYTRILRYITPDVVHVMFEGRIVAEVSAEELTRQVAGTSEVHWSRAGERFVHATDDATPFVRRLFEQHGEEITDLEVRRASLEDTYLAMVQRHEAGDRSAPTLVEAAR